MSGVPSCAKVSSPNMPLPCRTDPIKGVDLEIDKYYAAENYLESKSGSNYTNSYYGKYLGNSDDRKYYMFKFDVGIAAPNTKRVPVDRPLKFLEVPEWEMTSDPLEKLPYSGYYGGGSRRSRRYKKSMRSRKMKKTKKTKKSKRT
jgi:hypothetical protein